MQKDQLDYSTRKIIAVIIQNWQNQSLSVELKEIYHILKTKYKIDITDAQYGAKIASFRIPFKQWCLTLQAELPVLSDFLGYLKSTE